MYYISNSHFPSHSRLRLKPEIAQEYHRFDFVPNAFVCLNLEIIQNRKLDHKHTK